MRLLTILILAVVVIAFIGEGKVNAKRLRRHFSVKESQTQSSKSSESVQEPEAADAKANDENKIAKRRYPYAY